MSSPRIRTYVPLIQKFVARVFLYHAGVSARLGLNTSDLKTLQLPGVAALSPGEIGEKPA